GEQDKYKKTLWPRAVSSDDWSDSYESMIVLWKRYPSVGDGFAWLDWATHQHIHRRQPDKKYGPYTGGHFDGSTGRCLAVHAMMCSRGVRHVPWQESVCVGAVQNSGELLLAVSSKSPYRGKLCFDGPRTQYPAATIDWARINEMPQWFIAGPEKTYVVSIDGSKPRSLKGRELIEGLEVAMQPGIVRKICVKLAGE
ncbi:MAG: hypothetical protein JXM70_18595, partial [Pirellulales bacterium]|nr:hypothetical protein [Pirellulales bacterium]